MKLTLNKHKLNKLNQDKLQEAISILKSGKYEKHKKSLVHSSIPCKACCLGVVALEVDKAPLNELHLIAPKKSLSPFSYELAQLTLNKPNTRKQLFIKGLAALNDGFTFFYKSKHIKVELTHPEIAELLEGKTIDYSSRLFYY